MTRTDLDRLLLRDPHVRGAILEILGALEDDRAHFSEVVQGVLRSRRNLSSIRRRTVADTAYDLVRMRRKTAYLLRVAATEAGVPAGALPAAEERLCRYAVGVMATAGMHAYDVASAGLSEAASRLALAVGDVEARLAAIDDPLERLGVEASVPDWIAERVARQQGLDEARALLLAMNRRAPLTLRANLLRTDREALIARLAQEGVEGDPSALSPLGVRLRRHVNVRALHAYRRGLFEPQDQGSQLIALAVGARPGARVVDLCAGSGGKTLAIAAAMEGRGQLLATDIDPGRLRRMRPRLKRARVENVTVHPAGRPLPRAWRGAADRVLVDAPCSGSGTFRRVPEKRWRLQPESVARLAVTQREILDRAAGAVRAGGWLVYATCSIFHEENAEVVAGFLADHPGFHPLPVAEALGPKLSATVADAAGHLRMWPHRHDTDGFFAALLLRGG